MAGPKSAFLIIEWAIKSRRRLIINLQWVYDCRQTDILLSWLADGFRRALHSSCVCWNCTNFGKWTQGHMGEDDVAVVSVDRETS